MYMPVGLMLLMMFAFALMIYALQLSQLQEAIPVTVEDPVQQSQFLRGQVTL